MNHSLQSSILGACAFHTAGLLPDADGPYSPAVWNANAWLVSFAFEISLATLQVRAISSIPSGSTGFEAAQLCLSVGRTVVLATMLAVFWAPRVLRLGSPDGSGETERLIPSGSNSTPSAYGTAKDNLVNGAAISQSYDAQHTEWTDYVSGFSKLFPFLWLVELPSIVQSYARCLSHWRLMFKGHRIHAPCSFEPCFALGF